MPEARRQPSVFVGRHHEIDAINERVRDALDDRASVVWIEGEAGWGKTALLRRVLDDLPAGATTLWAEADELAAEVPYGVVGQLHPVDDPNPFGAGLAVLAHLGDLQAGGPVVVVVEDLHWADDPSRQALLTVARRLGRDRVVMLVTSRPTPDLADGWDRLVLDDTRCCAVRLGPLTADDVGRWAGLTTTGLSAAQSERLRHHTGGHPLYLRTLLSELSVDQLRSTANDLPAPRSLAAATIGALGSLPPEAQLLAAAMAVAGTRAPLAEVARVAQLTEPTTALEALLGTGIVAWWPAEPSTPVDFAHPLYRTAVYDDLSPTRRQGLHRAMADHLSPAESWVHRVAAADGPDDDLADELDAGARAALDHGDPASAVRLLLWAAPLTTATPTAEDRLLRAALLLAHRHQTDRLHELLPRLRACAPSPRRDLLLGIDASARGDLTEAQRRLQAAAEPPVPGAPDEPSARAEAYAHLSAVFINRADFPAAGQAAEDALRLDGAHPTVGSLAWGSRALARANAAGTRAGLAVLAERLPVGASDVDPVDVDLLVTRAMMALHHDGAGVVDDLETAIELIRQGHGGASLLARAHLVLGEALERQGPWDEATRHARAAAELVDLSGSDWYRGRAEATLGMVAAAHGDLDGARQHQRTTAAAARTIGSPWTKTADARLTALISTLEGDHVAAVATLLPQASDPHPSNVNVLFASWWPPLIDALIGANRLDDAAEHLARFEERLAAVDGPATASLGRRGRLAFARGDLGAADQLLGASFATEAVNDPVLDTAVLRREHGRVLLALGRRDDAAATLRAAHDTFAALGAEPFRLEVAVDLGAVGAPAEPRARRSPLDCTERERDVVALARRGLTNREIAGELYVSEKAIEYHLRNVYGKVGVRSRRELFALEAASGDGAVAHRSSDRAGRASAIRS
jgi:DNA-binding CsgD family transcriptional regulator/tetratricopeptide (TPR) repeat protein